MRERRDGENPPQLCLARAGRPTRTPCQTSFPLWSRRWCAAAPSTPCARARPPAPRPWSARAVLLFVWLFGWCMFGVCLVVSLFRGLFRCFVGCLVGWCMFGFCLFGWSCHVWDFCRAVSPTHARHALLWEKYAVRVAVPELPLIAPPPGPKLVFYLRRDTHPHARTRQK